MRIEGREGREWRMLLGQSMYSQLCVNYNLKVFTTNIVTTIIPTTTTTTTASAAVASVAAQQHQ